MAPKNPRSTPGTSNPEIPESTPRLSGADNWTLKAVNDLAVAIGRLETRLEHVSEKIGDLKTDQGETSGRMLKAENKILIAGAFLSCLIIAGGAVAGFAGYVGNKAIDFGIEMAKQKINTETPPQPPAPTTVPKRG